MSIPPLQKTGTLPPGLHRAPPDEIVAGFCGGTPTRAALERPLRELISIAKEIESPGLYFNGSFVTGKEHPGDIDAIIVLPEGFDTASDHAKRIRALHREHTLDIERVSDSDAEELNYLLTEFFGHDRNGHPRGLLEVAL